MAKTTKKTSKTDQYYAELTDMLVEQLESNPTGWTKSWTGGTATGLPTNAVTGNSYNGSNIMFLLVAAHVAGYSSQKWATYKQWRSIGAQVMKGSESSTGAFWNQKDAKDAEGNVVKDDQGRTKKYWFMVTFSLFNLDQVVAAEEFTTKDGTVVPGATPEQAEALDAMRNPVALTEVKRDKACDEFFALTGSTVTVGEPSYSPTQDIIRMPHIDRFDTATDYYATKAHEHGHWTGHKSRLNRDLANRFGDDAYAFEELIAELTAVFIGAHLGFAAEPREDHAQYINHWMRVAKSDKSAVYKAAALAAKAATFLIAGTHEAQAAA